MAGRSSAELVPFFAAIRFTLFFVFLESSKPVRRWTRDKYRRHGIGASSFFPASSANTTTGLAREGQIRFFHPLGFLFFFFSFFFLRGTKRSSQEVVDIVVVERSPGGWERG